MRALGLELPDNHHREDDFVLVEASKCAWIGEQNAGVEDVDAT
jgi:hypothetical protein